MLEEEIEGLRAELIAGESVEILVFNEGSVLATFGTKAGPLTAPILAFEVTGQDSLVVHDEFPIIWEHIEFDGEALSVSRNGKRVTYKATKRDREAAG